MKIMSTTMMVVVMAFAFAVTGNTAMAFPDSGKVGQKANEPHPDGDVTRVEFVEGDWNLIMPYRGDFGGDPSLDSGWIKNIYTDREGNAVLYTFVHESDPRWSEDLDQIWGSWAVFQSKLVGKSYSTGQ